MSTLKRKYRRKKGQTPVPLSRAYSYRNKCFGVCYESHPGEIELISETFTCVRHAEAWIHEHKDRFEVVPQIIELVLGQVLTERK